MSGDARPAEPRPGRRAWPLAIAAATAVLLVRTWRTWPDVLVDFGRELYLAWRIAEGDVLYRDLAAFNGPLSPYWNALCWRPFGSYTGVLVSNAALLAAFLGCAYRLLRRAGDAFGAGVALLFFLATFAFGQTSGVGNFNFLAPYAHEATHGLVLSFAALAVLFGGSRLGAGRALAGGGLLGLVLLTKAELALAALVAVPLGAWLRLRAERDASARALARAFAGLALGALAPSALALAALARAMPLAEAARGVARAWPFWLPVRELGELAFYRGELGLGLDHPWRNLAWMGLGAGGCLTLAALAWRLDGALGRRGRGWGGVAAFALTGGLLLALPIDWGFAGRPLPLLVLAALGWAVLGLRRGVDRDERRRWALGVTLAAFALLLLAKMLLAVKLWHYGFVLAAPATMVVALLGLSWLPRRRGPRAPVLRGSLLALFVVVGGVYWHTTSGAIARKRVAVGTGGDRILADARGVFVNRALAELARRLGPDDTLLVLPEGVMIDYLARRRAPTRYFNFMPPELILFGEEAMLEALLRAPPDAVLLVHKDTDEYGLPLFGRDYGQRLMAWVRAEYHEVWRDPEGDAPLEPGSRFGVALLAR